MHFNSALRTLAVFFVFAVGAAASFAHAQQAKVIKVQGKKAIVQFPDDARPRVGQMLDLGSATSIDGGSSSGASGGNGSREMIIGGSAALSSLTNSSSSTSSTGLSVDARYGWNKQIMEYGALAGMTYTSAPGSSSRLLEGGGFFDYNLVPNTPGTEIVYGAGGVAKVGSLASTIGSSETTGSRITLQGGGQLKWFPLGNSVAIRGDVFYSYVSNSSSGGSSTTTSGLIAMAGFYIYF